MKKPVAILVSIAVLAGLVLTSCGSVLAGAVYTGSLAYPNQITAGGNWASTTTSIAWAVTEKQAGWWGYYYTVTVKNPAISHYILGMSTSITDQNLSAVISNLTINGIQYSVDADNLVGPDWFSSAVSNPGIPAGVSFWGLKIEDIEP